MNKAQESSAVCAHNCICTGGPRRMSMAARTRVTFVAGRQTQRRNPVLHTGRGEEEYIKYLGEYGQSRKQLSA